MKPTLLKKVKIGQYFVISSKPQLNEDYEVKSKYVYVRGDYIRELKKYEVYKFDNVCDCKYMKGDRIVYVDFIF